MSTTLINRLEAARQINDKAREMIRTNNQNDELTDDEKEQEEENIDQHKQTYLNKIDDQLTNEGVTSVVDEGLLL